jgi:hypothetical protein
MNDDSTMYFVPVKSRNDFKAGSLYRYNPLYSVVLCLYDSLQDYHCYALGYSAEPGTVFMIISVSKDQPEKVLTNDGYIGYAGLYYPDIEIAVNNQ